MSVQYRLLQNPVTMSTICSQSCYTAAHPSMKSNRNRLHGLVQHLEIFASVEYLRRISQKLLVADISFTAIWHRGAASKRTEEVGIIRISPRHREVCRRWSTWSAAGHVWRCVRHAPCCLVYECSPSHSAVPSHRPLTSRTTQQHANHSQ